MAENSFIYTFLSALLTLFPVLNPLSQGLIISGYLQGYEGAQIKTAGRKVLFNSLLICFGSLLLGHLILMLFGLAVPVIQVGGGIIICKTGYDLLSSDDTSMVQSAMEGPRKSDRLFYPISFPIAVGPGAISVIFTLMATSAGDDILTTVINYILMGVAMVLLLCAMYFVAVNGLRLMKKIGPSGNAIVNKLVAFLTFCIGIQILVTGIAKIFHLTVL